MKYINPKTNRGIVNKFADHILTEINKLGDYDSVIEVSDCGKFFIVNGFSSYENPLDLNDIKESFLTKNNDVLDILGYKDINIINLIDFDVTPNKKDEFWFKFYNTSRPTYSKTLTEYVEQDTTPYISIDNDLKTELDFNHTQNNIKTVFEYPPLTVTSEFPHGYSLNMGRIHYYYSEYVAYNSMTASQTKEMDFKISTIKDSDEDFMFELRCKSIYNDNVVKSMILDVFDFDLESFKHVVSTYDFSKDIDEPFAPKPWLFKDRINDCIIF